ncbi:bifunctional 4-hydroxy-2-oxoglutarate aldolase/2-dehydro-3-deoxy-phosphogluconate aldolase [Dorea sp. D27]|uniref:bifunctional 4-hydroxy-2-oxoglutarate aldolase/2-dehydro-3-deoxy-phosphogluconate aldolase n=1 Tax=Dorea sp. D27 TaxID=658665 RepID=UPI0006732AFC|nr:bifunctional 4-hydroxy-2-oxoglutarate aldolase/2-dehydro-3-deoxy-phosphogluconate aldolase [Dorea sp. D27]KMZ53387.1 2-dehydro-3-deoxyphosphogluconate aldolase/4-hydroxy-2-oxoglutarate aldolase [Dorea sp. D27]
MNTLEQIRQYRLVPVIKLDEASNAAPLAEALCEGGLPVAEVTFRTDAARESIEIMARRYPNMLIGAGSLTNSEQARQAVDAGARFLVSAGFSRQVTEYALDNGIPVLPGICTPTELMLLVEYGLSAAKFFPAEQFGGLKTIQALSAPFPGMRFMPTGGISPKNVADYLSFPKIIACGGSWMVKDSLIRNNAFGKIRALTEEAAALVQKEA